MCFAQTAALQGANRKPRKCEQTRPAAIHALHASSSSHDRPRQAKTGPGQVEKSQHRPKTGPRQPKDRPKTGPRQAQDRPRQAQDRPRQDQDSPTTGHGIKKHWFRHRFFETLGPNLVQLPGGNRKNRAFFRYLGPTWANLGEKGIPRHPKTSQESRNKAKKHPERSKMKPKGETREPK